MRKTQACILISICIFLYQAYAKRSGSRKRDRDLEDLIKNGEEKVGILVGSFVGDFFLAVKGGKLVGVKDFKKANLFDIDLPTKESPDKEVKLEVWVKGKKFVITYNSVGEDINIEIPMEADADAKSNLTIIRNVIAENARKAAFEVMSSQRKRCFSIDPNTTEVTLQECANGSNDMQTFRFLSFKEAIKNEANKRGGSAFSMGEYTSNTRVPANSIFVADKSGVLYNQ
ncbi:uncharacterized protein NEMAJ01_1969 [Nematocida major]|uniref:uncharacterized protein n=1 Tax=Nematocida major TaxID=1912982 RepID=UPI0020072BE9|nr:uncharacterized protein NEMAJ01_1969 [Nematocida major]KAH9387073.1 hypothetical protein NEMAJ01_1969 [Nematocida major]